MSAVPSRDYLATLKALLVLAVCACISVCSQVDLEVYVSGYQQSVKLVGSGDEFDSWAVSKLCCAPWQVQAAVVYFAHHAGLKGRASCC